MRTKCWFGSLKGRDNSNDRRRWEDNIKMDLRKIGFGGMDFIYLAQDRDRWVLVNTITNFGFHKRRKIPGLVERRCYNFSRRNLLHGILSLLVSICSYDLNYILYSEN
jgi:hypothetical protein